MHWIHIDPLQHLALVEVSGDVDGDGLLAANEALYGHYAWGMEFDECWDCRSIENFAVALEEIREVAYMESQPEGPVPTGRVVIVAPSEDVALIGRLYCALMNSMREVHVVSTVDDAQEVLAPKRLAIERLKL